MIKTKVKKYMVGRFTMKGFYHIITYGCQMNEHDSERLAGQLRELGYSSIDDYTKADIIILNTCCVRENAELKVFGKIGELKALKRKKPDLIIGIAGCMMQQENVVEELLKKYPHVDLIFGTHNIHQLGDLVRKVIEKRKRIVEVWDEGRELIPELPSERKSPFQAWVSIILGCNNFCTYCIVPYVRGRERSRPMEDIIREVKRLVADGVIEITLLGQNVNSYGKDFKNCKVGFADLLKELDKIEGLKRIRYMTSHPRDFSDKLIETIRDSKKVCEHFHLPMQSGSSRILKKMNRGYTQESYLELIRKIREAVPEASITTDFIVGFPGETEEDFAETLKVVEMVEFDAAYTFMYSPRSGTPAAKFEDQISEEVKKERLQRLMELQAEKSLKKNKKLEGQIVEVLVEGESKSNPERFQGRTRTNKLVLFDKKDEDLTGKLVNIRINRAQSWNLYGEIVKGFRVL
ncbi:tRNA (N6-isopentenyl adenosine(37)-C2)-methylthiotransferase MiaB [Anoxybacter fermentans]|uniref:tRNA-2-methylthio-N(6)-dimethylallyladenosine synthase n=1 Tax=Anoxybacter fermentans TaxID=1323375 RepID=A0A3S9SWE5_9FIRM|nr:tRNA (N6-isopentenyl adenosine(37)-C2)-methylthiotransferase MiaB [Anoxybacter fermentans]